MTNMMTLVHADAHCREIHEWFCQTVQGPKYHSEYVHFPLLIWFQAIDVCSTQKKHQTDVTLDKCHHLSQFPPFLSCATFK